MDIIGEATQPRHNCVVVGVKVAKGRRAVLGDHGRARSHGHTDAALGFFDVIEAVAVFRHTAIGIGGLVGRGKHSVANGEVLQCKWLQQRIIGRHRAPRTC